MGIASLVSLPNDSVNEIVSYLPVGNALCFGQTCRRFYELLEDPVAWAPMARNLGLDSSDSQLSRKEVFEKIKNIYAQIPLLYLKEIPKSRLITNFSSNLRTAWISMANGAGSYGNWYDKQTREIAHLRSAWGLNCYLMPKNCSDPFFAALAKQAYPLARVIQAEDSDFAIKLIEAGAEVNEYHLDLAIRKKNLGILENLLKKISPDDFHLALPASLKNGGMNHDANLDKISKELEEAAQRKPLSFNERARREESIAAAFSYEQIPWGPLDTADGIQETVQRVESIAASNSPAGAIGALRGYFLRNQHSPLIVGDGLLHSFIKNQQSESLEAYLSAGFRPKNRSLFKPGSLIAALSIGNQDVIDLLIKADARADDADVQNKQDHQETEKALIGMLRNNIFKNIERILSSGFAFSDTQLLDACVEINDEEKIYQLLEKGTAPTIRTLRKAIHNRHYLILNRIIGFIASRNINFDYKPSFTTNNDDCNERLRSTLITECLQTEDPRIIRLALKLFVQAWGWKLPHLNEAIDTNRPEIVQIFLEAGSSPRVSKWAAMLENLMDNSVHRAILSGNEEIVDLILRAGGRPTKQAIHEVLSRIRNPAIIEKLLSAGVKPLAQGALHSDSPCTLDMALESPDNLPQIADLLIQAKAPMSQNTLALAQRTKNLEVIEKLESYHRSLNVKRPICRMCTSSAGKSGPQKKDSDLYGQK